MGETRTDFFGDEQAGLEPFRQGLFDDLINGPMICRRGTIYGHSWTAGIGTPKATR
jgi:hypothetical protein